ncbi:MAG: amidase, partial [Candidatus Methylomirabilales bacterium]
VVAGPDPQDPTASHVSIPDYSRALQGGLKGITIGIPKDFFFDPTAVDPFVMTAVEEALQVIQEAGARVEEVSLPLLRLAPAIQFLTISSEATANHSRLLRTRSRELGEDVRRRLEVGEFLGASQYVRAQQARGLLMREFSTAFGQVDLLVTPTVPVVAPPIGAQTVKIHNVPKRLQPTLTSFTSPFNLTGLPAISVPCSSGGDRLPVGLQIVGRPFDEATILRAAFAYQQATPWHTHRPSLGK